MTDTTRKWTTARGSTFWIEEGCLMGSAYGRSLCKNIKQYGLKGFIVLPSPDSQTFVRILWDETHDAIGRYSTREEALSLVSAILKEIDLP